MIRMRNHPIFFSVSNETIKLKSLLEAKVFFLLLNRIKIKHTLNNPRERLNIPCKKN